MSPSEIFYKAGNIQIPFRCQGQAQHKNADEPPEPNNSDIGCWTKFLTKDAPVYVLFYVFLRGCAVGSQVLTLGLKPRTILGDTLQIRVQKKNVFGQVRLRNVKLSDNQPLEKSLALATGLPEKYYPLNMRNAPTPTSIGWEYCPVAWLGNFKCRPYNYNIS